MPEKNYRTIAIRLDETLHAQITLVAQLAGVTLVDAIRDAIATHIAAARSEGDLAERAAAALEAFEEEAAERRRAIEALLAGPTATEPEAEGDATASPRRNRSGKPMGFNAPIS